MATKSCHRVVQRKICNYLERNAIRWNIPDGTHGLRKIPLLWRRCAGVCLESSPQHITTVADDVTLYLNDAAQEQLKTKLEEEAKNKQFEQANKEFCDQFMEDIEERNKAIKDKDKAAEAKRNQGNIFYKKKKYAEALDLYMESLKIRPYDVKTVLNIAQVSLK